MILLTTGVPGSSKTLNNIKRLCEDSLYTHIQKDKDSPKQKRKIYYYNVKDVKHDWVELTEEQAKNWFDLPFGSVVFLDECQELFRPQRHDAIQPRTWTELEKHRHLGIDIILGTQHPSLIDTKVRRQVGRHIHYERKFGMDSVQSLTWEKCVNNPDDYFLRSEAIKKRVKLDSKYFGTYKSAEIHTVKKTLPYFKLASIAVLAVLSISALVYVASNFGSSSPSDLPVVDALPIVEKPLSTIANKSDSKVLTREQYLKINTPRVVSIPSSAPKYDKLTDPQTFPRAQCIQRVSTGDCRCYTQQATPLNLPFQQCLKIVKHGYFDDTRISETSRDSKPTNQSGADGGSSAIDRLTRAYLIRKSMNNS